MHSHVASPVRNRDIQKQFAVAVVIPTVLRPHLRWALESVFRQDLEGSIQVLIGIDKPLGERSLLDALLLEAPPNVHITVLDPGYSTSVRHGGIYSTHYGGALRTILSYLANSHYIAYLDDDDWFAPGHLSSLLTAIRGHAWAYSLRWYGHPARPEGLCIDEWESTGPDTGIFKERFGGFVAPSCMMLDKSVCHMLLPFWSVAMFADGGGEDRRIFEKLRGHGFPGGATHRATSYCTLDPNDAAHPLRIEWMRGKGVDLPDDWLEGPPRLVGR
jgi:hypothetical protein